MLRNHSLPRGAKEFSISLCLTLLNFLGILGAGHENTAGPGLVSETLYNGHAQIIGFSCASLGSAKEPQDRG